MLAPEVERADTEPADHRLRRLRLAPRRQHAAGPVAGGFRHARVAALVQGDGVAGLRKQERLPGTCNACAYNCDGGIPPRLGSLVHPCPFAGMTRIRFKGSPRMAVSQLLLRSTPRNGPNVGAKRRVSTRLCAVCTIGMRV